MSDDVKWEDPPPPKGGHGMRQWPNRLAPLQAKPGKWANLGPASTALAYNLRHGRISGVEPSEWEFTTRKVEGAAQPDLYARFVGKPNLKSAAS